MNRDKNERATTFIPKQLPARSLRLQQRVVYGGGIKGTATYRAYTKKTVQQLYLRRIINNKS